MSNALSSSATIDEKSPLLSDPRPAVQPMDDDWRERLDRVFRRRSDAFIGRAVNLVGKARADDLVGDTMCKLVCSYGRALNPLRPPATDDHMERVVFRALHNASVDRFIEDDEERSVIVASASEEVDGEEAADDADGLWVVPDDEDEGVAAPASVGLSELDQAAVTAVESELDAKELESLLDDALAALPQMQEMVFTYRECFEESRSDTAEALKISVRTVDAHLQAAYRTMRVYLLEQAPWLGSERLVEMFHQRARRHAVRSGARRTRKDCRALMAADALARDVRADGAPSETGGPHDQTMAA